MGGQQARREKIRQLLPEQRVQRGAAFERVGRAQEQSGRDGVGMPGSFQQIVRACRVGLVGDAQKRPLRKIELNDMQGPVDVPT
ncbi:hypothetical protein ACVWWK_001841 [Bradyrhizobium sp. LB9.1b]